MASMPPIDDDMVELFRRTGKRRTSYSSTNSSSRPVNTSRFAAGRSGGTPRVVPQSADCAGKDLGTPCGTLLCPDGRKAMQCDGSGGCTVYSGCS